MRFVATWNGADPVAGDVLISGHRPRYAYVITEVVRRTRRGRLILEVERYRLEEVAGRFPPGSRVHLWKWDARKKGPPK